MKKIKNFILCVASLALCIPTNVLTINATTQGDGISYLNSSSSSTVKVTELSSNSSNFSITLEDGLVYEFERLDYGSSMTLVNQSVQSKNYSTTVVREYRCDDNTTIYDTVEISKGVTRSDVGEDIVTRETNVNNFSTVGITATFDWNNYNSTRKVQCSAMTAWHSTPSGVTCQYFNKSKSNGYVTLGKAYAKVEYKFYNTAIPVNAYSGYFKISCSDTGTISDSVG